MALPRKAASKLACSDCQQWVLRSFMGSVNSTRTTRPVHHRRPFATGSGRRSDDHALNEINAAYSPPIATAIDEQRRPSPHVERRKQVASKGKSTSKAQKAEADDDIEVTGAQLQEMLELEEAIAAEEAQARAQRRADRAAERAEQESEVTSSSPDQGEHIPWYLQVQSPITPTESTLSSRQKIPDLPTHPPDLLAPLINQVSVDLGLDDLTLLDLRELNPPPALGANLLMLIGTARSEKHLHVSADKLCRWLRSEHKLAPFADGLLGRQELKVKLRRRAKRARLMSAVGAKGSDETELDEGIRTGWVCVNIGRIEGGELPMTDAEIEAERRVVGFGTRTRGCHIVVQMMTEEKRGDLDLETLWTRMLDRSRKAQEDLLNTEEDQPAVDGVERAEQTGGVEEEQRFKGAERHEQIGDVEKEKQKRQAGELVSFSPVFDHSPVRQDVRA